MSMSRLNHRLLILILGLVGWVGFILVRFPGEMNPDSQSQLEQAMTGTYNDWHPPIMARLWSLFLSVSDGVWTMFVFQMVCWALAFVLLALTLARLGHRVGAWAVFLVGFFPPFLMQIVNIHKDVGLAATVMLAVALVARTRLAGEKTPLWAAVIAGLLLLYAGLVRTNGWFVVLPVALWMLWPAGLRRPLRSGLLMGLAALVLVLPSGMINHGLLGARDAGALRTLQIFDMAGIAHVSRDLSGLEGHITLEEIDECYTPVIADTFYHARRCGFLWDRIAGSPDTPTGLATDIPGAVATEPASLGGMWVSAIARHPLAWAEHRLRHFNAAMQFLIPGHQAALPAIHAIVDGQPAALPPLEGAARIMDLVRYGPWATPALWLALGLGVLIITHDARRRGDPLATLSLALTLAGCSYMGAFLFIGVANDPRYGLVGGATILTAVALLIPGFTDYVRRFSDRLSLATLIAVATVIAMLAYRASVPDALYVALRGTL
ncbi:glycosyltransferase family 39 protein [Ciceribacter sp. L1K23]|uniref:glycosyltransferase family 39 protein n=1 Tax=Ciceribacter sp. L1K23 TaxID=2820276 RepID=UPI001B822945|nr:glycosyltransferase family 39 protein [Ciceribacter sp. L1K23]MBR0556555.1 glycosyltransferase family 39 protein [Ciceribacter sp. L1K23]